MNDIDFTYYLNGFSFIGNETRAIAYINARDMDILDGECCEIRLRKKICDDLRAVLERVLPASRVPDMELDKFAARLACEAIDRLIKEEQDTIPEF